jgi:hypothetical protein
LQSAGEFNTLEWSNDPDGFKKISTWTPDKSSLIPQEVLDYFMETNDDQLSSELAKYILKDFETDEKLVLFKVDKEIDSYIAKFWKDRGVDWSTLALGHKDAMQKFERIEGAVISALSNARQIAEDKVVDKIAKEFSQVAIDKKSGAVTHRELDEFLFAKDLTIPGSTKQRIYGRTNARLAVLRRSF